MDQCQCVCNVLVVLSKKSNSFRLDRDVKDVANTYELNTLHPQLHLEHKFNTFVLLNVTLFFNIGVVLADEYVHKDWPYWLSMHTDSKLQYGKLQVWL